MKTGLEILSITILFALNTYAQAVLKILPQVQSVGIDSISSINLYIENVYDLHAYSIKISYNPELVKYESIQKGDFLSDQQTFFYPLVDTLLGTLQIDEAILGTDSENGSGSLAVIFLKGKNNGEVPLKITDHDFRDSSNASIQVDVIDGSIVVDNISTSKESAYAASTEDLLTNYPNPFNSSTILKFISTRNEEAELRIYSLTGRTVYAKLFRTTSGENFLRWNGVDNGGITLSSGFYIVNIITTEKNYYKKIILLK